MDARRAGLDMQEMREGVPPPVKLRPTRSPVYGVVSSILLIVVGTLFFLDSLGWLHIYNVWRFWPIFVIGGGLSRLLERRDATGKVWGAMVAVIGGLFLLDSFGLLEIHFSAIWPLGLVALGVLTLTRALSADRPPAIGDVSQSAETVNELAIFSSSKRRVETRNFRGGEILCVFAGVNLDLRRAELAVGESRAVIDITAVFGGVDIKVPESWKVVIRGVAVFGAYEEKTIPPRPESYAAAPELIITGNVVFGGVNIKN